MSPRLRTPVVSTLGVLVMLGAGGIWLRSNLPADSQSSQIQTGEGQSPSGQPPYGQAVGVGALLEGARGPVAAHEARAAAMVRARSELPGAPESILALATSLFMGEPVATSDLARIDPQLLTYVFHAPEALDMGGGSLAREAAALGRMDVLLAMAQAGVSTHADGVLGRSRKLDPRKCRPWQRNPGTRSKRRRSSPRP